MNDPFRAFVALPFEDSVRADLAAAAASALKEIGEEEDRSWRAVPERNLHLTLRFLGDIPREAVPSLREALSQVVPGFSIESVDLQGWLLLPSAREPRVLAIGLSDPTGTLHRLQAALEDCLEEAGFPREGRPFLAHVTVARSRFKAKGGYSKRRRGGGRIQLRRPKGGRRKTVTPLPSTLQGGPVASPVVRRVALMESRLESGGAIYDEVEAFALSERDGSDDGRQEQEER
ncbi:MAG: RNA 2',3'-cyclic phosphodiesterase [Planctomycetota bacterium]|jgi:2'-5' RNA ligase